MRKFLNNNYRKIEKHAIRILVINIAIILFLYRDEIKDAIAYAITYIMVSIIAYSMTIESHSYDKIKPTEFFRIDEGWQESYDESKNEYKISFKLESFVISNPPNDSSLLRKMVAEYNLRTMPVDTIKKYKSYERVFYRETKCLTRYYKKGEPYPKDQGCGSYYGKDPGQQAGYHYYENLMETEYYSFSNSYWKYSYKFGRYFGNTDYKRIEIKDIDLFFEEGRKRLGK
jgi:hypothetical protein